MDVEVSHVPHAEMRLAVCVCVCAYMFAFGLVHLMLCNMFGVVCLVHPLLLGSCVVLVRACLCAMRARVCVSRNLCGGLAARSPMHFRWRFIRMQHGPHYGWLQHVEQGETGSVCVSARVYVCACVIVRARVSRNGLCHGPRAARKRAHTSANIPSNIRPSPATTPEDALPAFPQNALPTLGSLRVFALRALRALGAVGPRPGTGGSSPALAPLATFVSQPVLVRSWLAPPARPCTSARQGSMNMYIAAKSNTTTVRAGRTARPRIREVTSVTNMVQEGAVVSGAWRQAGGMARAL